MPLIRKYRKPRKKSRSFVSKQWTTKKSQLLAASPDRLVRDCGSALEIENFASSNELHTFGLESNSDRTAEISDN